VDAIHGGKSQGQRQKALNRFKQNEINVLVATDVAARGIDVADITHVINYTVPKTFGDYIHRIGRTGRAGRTGQALTFVAQ
jgi:superfamily II DNA/RNA helicase